MTEWNKILHQKQYSREEPDENVVNFAKRLRKKKGLRILDLGCGAGRNQIYIAKQGFETYGTDISETGLTLTKSRLKQQRLTGHLIKCDMKMQPYTDSCFDAIICLHTIYHQELKEIKKTISEIHRTLRKNGQLLVNFLSERTYSYGKGLKIEENTFIEQEGAEKGIVHHFADREEIVHLFEDFETVNLELNETEVEGKLRSRWIVTATK